MATDTTIYTKDDWKRRMEAVGTRGRRAYYAALEQDQAVFKSRLKALELAADGLEQGKRAFGVARPWPALAGRLRAIARDLAAGIKHARMMKDHNPSNPDTQAAQGLDIPKGE